MSELDPLIIDLAKIMICAGATTLLFKWLKQPVVLGYIVAGFLASPNMPYTPSVTDLHGIHIWAGVLVQEDPEDGGSPHHCRLRHYSGYDTGRHIHGQALRMEPDGLYLLRRYAGHVIDHHHIQGF